MAARFASLLGIRSIVSVWKISSHCQSLFGADLISIRKMGDAKEMFNHNDNRKERLIWIDLEMTGLKVETDKIIEIACLVTTGNLDIVAEGPNIVINQPKDLMDSMDDWCRETHGRSGLTKAVLESVVSTKEAEQRILSFVEQHTVKGQAPLAGNSVHMDKVFLERYMPALASHLHYRIVDVSTIKELCRRWYAEYFNSAPKKALTHRALDDIRESIEELRYYRRTIFKSPGQNHYS